MDWTRGEKGTPPAARLSAVVVMTAKAIDTFSAKRLLNSTLKSFRRLRIMSLTKTDASGTQGFFVRIVRGDNDDFLRSDRIDI